MHGDEHRPPRRRTAAWWFVVLVVLLAVSGCLASAALSGPDRAPLHGRGTAGTSEVAAPRTTAPDPSAATPIAPGRTPSPAVSAPNRPHVVPPAPSTTPAAQPAPSHGGPQCPGGCGHQEFGVRVDDVTGLYPGSVRALAVRYSNPHAFAITVVNATVTAVSRTPGCAGSSVVTGSYPTRTVVGARGTSATTLPFGLRTTAPDACKGARWTVTVTARGEKR